MSYSSRVLRVCALLALPGSAFAQSTKGPTIFSPASQVGTVNLRAAIVLQDYTVKPLPLLKVVALRNSERPDSVSAQTDLDGRAVLTLNVGMYTVRARTPQPIAGRMYEWAVKVVVRSQQSQSLDLTNSNASRSDSVATTPTVVAEAKPAPQPPPTGAPQPTPVQPTPTQPTPAPPTAAQPQPQTAQAKAASAKATPAKGTPAKSTQPKATQPQPAQPQPVTPQSVAPTSVASQPSSPPATPPKASAPPKSEAPTTTPPKSTAPSNPVPPVKPAPTSTGEKAVAKSEPPKQAPTPTPAPATPSSVPVTTAKATPLAPAPSAAPATKHVATTARPPRRTNTSGLMLGLSFDASSIRSDDLNSRTESGPGIAGMLGWGITKNIALALDLSGAQISSVDGNYNLGHADIGARWHFVNRTAFVPFVDVGYAGRALMKRNVTLTDALGNTSTGTLTYMGAGLSYGGGLQYFVTPGIAFGGAFKWTTGRFSEVRFENLTVEDLQLDASSARFNMGFTWYPMGHR
jgi:outer membrane protein with beta-barrel domain